MSHEEDDSSIRFLLGLLFGLLFIVIGLVLSVSIYQSNKWKAAAAKANMAAAPAVAAPVVETVTVVETPAAGDDDSARVVVENGVVKFYFASGKADLATNANEALTDVVSAIKAGRKAKISGYHDASGSAARNAELAKERAIAVKNALVAAGVLEASLELVKPEMAQADGPAAEARRVEVTLVE